MRVPIFGGLGKMKYRLVHCIAVFFIFTCWVNTPGQETRATPGELTQSTTRDTPVPAETAKPEPSDPSKIKVVFDEKTPGVVYVESNGQRVRVDTLSKTVESMSSTSAPVADQAVATTGQPSANDARPDPKKTKDKYEFKRGEEPYDYRIVNVPTPRTVPKGTWNLVFTHRFTQPINPISESGKNLLGLDSFGIASFGVLYGVTNKLYLSAYRSPLCQKGICRTIEVGVGYNWFSHSKESPIAFTTYASVEGNDNFTEEFNYNIQAMLSARIGKRVYLFFSPAAHFNMNGQHRFDPRPTDFFPPAAAASKFHQPNNGGTFGIGASVLITPNVAILFDIAPRIGFKLGRVIPVRAPNFTVTGFLTESHPSIGFGIQRNIGQHSFALTFSNTQATTTSRYNSSNLTLTPNHLIIGFNLSRRF